jgi:EAL domain-containing protein (putative c-di-GMP-specific phosphodiesterase class I)
VGAGHAVAACARWRATLFDAAEFGMSINISAKQLIPGFVDIVRDTLARHDVPASAIVLELTEGVLVDGGQFEHEMLEELRRLGIRIAVDDFGTGYSSLSYLVRLPVDIIKLDRSFVKDVVGNAREASVVRAVSQLVRALGLALLAEGVEHADQRDALLVLGCDLAQGWYFDRPMTSAAVDARLAAD